MEVPQGGLKTWRNPPAIFIFIALLHHPLHESSLRCPTSVSSRPRFTTSSPKICIPNSLLLDSPTSFYRNPCSPSRCRHLMLLPLALYGAAARTHGGHRLPTPSLIIPTHDPPLDSTYTRLKVPTAKNTRPALQKADFRSRLTSRSLALLSLFNLLTDVDRMLEDEDMATYVRWHQERGLYGLLIPDIDAFVENALPRHFAGVKKVYGLHQQSAVGSNRSYTVSFFAVGKFSKAIKQLRI